jgi:hypothetical protein
MSCSQIVEQIRVGLFLEIATRAFTAVFVKEIDQISDLLLRPKFPVFG